VLLNPSVILILLLLTLTKTLAVLAAKQGGNKMKEKKEYQAKTFGLTFASSLMDTLWTGGVSYAAGLLLLA